MKLCSVQNFKTNPLYFFKPKHAVKRQFVLTQTCTNHLLNLMTTGVHYEVRAYFSIFTKKKGINYFAKIFTYLTENFTHF